MLLARHEIALSWKAIDDYLPSIRKVTPEDIQRVAKKYLIPDNRTVGILIPLPPKEGKPLPAGDAAKEHMVR
jgi:zinc protease